MYPWLHNSATQFQQPQPQLSHNSTTQNQQHQPQPQFSYNQTSYPNMYFQQPLQNMSFYQQHVQPSQYPHTQPIGDPHAPRPAARPAALEPSQRCNKNWSPEEDLQLTNAWCRIAMDVDVGVGQKKAKVWERIHELFVMLMEAEHGMKPQDNVRNPGGCENRMNDIKSSCSRWVATRVHAQADSRSGWCDADIEKLCHKMHEAEGKGAFKWENCWNVLKDCSKWQDYSNKKLGHNSSTARVKKKKLSTEVALNVTNLGALETQTPVTPHTISTTHSEPEISLGRGTCTPNLDGPASIDIERPPGKNKAMKQKVYNQRQRRHRQHAESQASASQSLTCGLITMESASNSRWDKQMEVERMRDLKDDERYNDARLRETKEHDLKLARERSEVTEKKEIIGEKLIAAIHKLDQIDHTSLITSNQKMVYNIRKKAVEDYERQYKELEETLECTTHDSPFHAPSVEKMASTGTSKKRLDLDTINLSEDEES